MACVIPFANFYRMLLALCLLVFCVSTASSQSSNLQYQVANVIEDVRLLDERIRRLTIQMEDLRRENSNLRDTIREYESNEQARMSAMVSVAQLNASVKQAVEALEARDEAAKKEVLAKVAGMMEDLQGTLTRVVNTSASPKPGRDVKTNFDMTGVPTSGVPYVVKSGDTLSGIATRMKSRSSWIQNANKISDPSLLQVGQTIFVPQKPQ